MESFWLLLPEHILNKLEERIGLPFTLNELFSALETSMNDQLKDRYPLLYKKAKLKIPNLSLNTLGKAISRLKTSENDQVGFRSDAGISVKNGQSILLDLICWYAYDMDWADTRKEYDIADEDLKINYNVSKFTRKSKDSNSDEETFDQLEAPDISQMHEPPILQGDNTIQCRRLPFVKVSRFFQFIDEGFWQDTKAIAETQKETILPRYFTHSDSSLIVKALSVDNFIIEPKESFLVIDGDEQMDELSFSQILDKSISQSLSLIKILAEGGVGKSTFLYWIAKKYCSQFYVFYIKKVDIIAANEIITFCEAAQAISSRPFILLIDDAAYAETVKNLEEFIVEIRERASVLNQFVVILAERTTRFNIQFTNNNFEKEFSGNIQTLVYKPPEKHELFEKLYGFLQKDNIQLADPQVKTKSKSIFLNDSIKSVSESLFLLLDDLNVKNVIRYDFDWDEWNKFIETHPTYKELRYLFVAVACFYQFGIRLRIGFNSSFLRNANRELILDAISSFNTDTSPIILEGDNNFLALKHEYVASWFVKYKKNEILVQGFFREFLTTVNNYDSAKLFRKIRKIYRTKEFTSSCLANEISAIKYLEIVNKYLDQPNLVKDEKEKMLNEKGMILFQLKMIPEAIATFTFIINEYPKSNHPRDQLARFYSRNTTTYQTAIELYFQILSNGGYYAFVEIRELLEKAKQSNVQIALPGKLDFTISIQENLTKQFENYPYNLKHSIVNEFIKSGELNFAESLLTRIKNPDNRTGECFYNLAKTLKFTYDSIEIKKQYFLKAISLLRFASGDYKPYSVRVDYAVFLFRIRQFSASKKYFKALINTTPPNSKPFVESHYYGKIRSTTKLFYQIPPTIDLQALDIFFNQQCIEAAPLINFKQTNNDVILGGYLILQTVKFHYRFNKNEMYYKVLKQLAYCHMMNASKHWSNFSERENRIIAENYFDLVLRHGPGLDETNYLNMVKNLLNFREPSKSHKAHILCDDYLKILNNQNSPSIYRYRGNAKRYLGNLAGAMEDYYICLAKLEFFQPEDIQHYYNAMAYLYNNMALVICDYVERNFVRKKFRIELADFYAKKVLQYRSDFKPLNNTWERIENVKLAFQNRKGFEIRAKA